MVTLEPDHRETRHSRPITRCTAASPAAAAVVDEHEFEG
jgi:hypothetical protein